jgi:hypothetical protein
VPQLDADHAGGHHHHDEQAQRQSSGETPSSLSALGLNPV